MKWGPPDEDGLVQFLVQEKGFNEDRVRKVVERIRGSRGKSNQGAGADPATLTRNQPRSWRLVHVTPCYTHKGSAILIHGQW